MSQSEFRKRLTVEYSIIQRCVGTIQTIDYGRQNAVVQTSAEPPMQTPQATDGMDVPTTRQVHFTSPFHLLVLIRSFGIDLTEVRSKFPPGAARRQLQDQRPVPGMFRWKHAEVVQCMNLAGSREVVGRRRWQKNKNRESVEPPGVEERRRKGV